MRWLFHRIAWWRWFATAPVRVLYHDSASWRIALARWEAREPKW